MKFYVNKNAQENGDHEVHTSECRFLPKAENRKSLGSFNNCKDAVRKAKKLGYKKADGCFHCSRPCHTQ